MLEAAINLFTKSSTTKRSVSIQTDGDTWCDSSQSITCSVVVFHKGLCGSAGPEGVEVAPRVHHRITAPSHDPLNPSTQGSSVDFPIV